MGMEPVVFLLESVGLQVYFLDIPEQVCIEYVLTIGPVEPFDVSVLARLAGLYVLDLDVLDLAIVDEYPR